MGRVVQSRPEPEWDEQERAWMYALADYEATLCPACGRPLDVCTAEDTELRVRPGEPLRCHISTAVDRKREKFTDNPYPQRLMFFPTLYEG